MTKEEELELALLNLASVFWLVFEGDWEFTKDILYDADFRQHFIAPDGTFLNPKVDDESNNWGNRGSLLAVYREARAVLHARGQDPEKVYGG